MSEDRRPVVLLSDFGQADWYVAAMKGVILGRAPRATLVDLTHSIPPGNAWQASWALGQTWPWYPERAVFVTVVDPGVGTQRRPLAVRAAGRFFVGPDNGILTSALEQPDAEVREIEAARVTDGPISATFHGRDLFAPAAAALACGAELATLGPLVADALRFPAEGAVREGTRLSARVLYVDHFGNCITNATKDDIDRLISEGKTSLVVRAGTGAIEGLSRTYGDREPGAALALIGSTGHLEIAVRDGHAAMRLGLAPGDVVTLEGDD